MHDVSEDTPITVEQIKKEFGEDVETWFPLWKRWP